MSAAGDSHEAGYFNYYNQGLQRTIRQIRYGSNIPCLTSVGLDLQFHELRLSKDIYLPPKSSANYDSGLIIHVPKDCYIKIEPTLYAIQNNYCILSQIVSYPYVGSLFLQFRNNKCIYITVPAHAHLANMLLYPLYSDELGPQFTISNVMNSFRKI